MEEYLAFVDEIGRNINGGYMYRFDFTVDKDTVWGGHFNVPPAGIIPGLQPDENCLSKRAKVIFPREMMIAKKNYCFSMQDCIDGIIPLIFSEIDDNTLVYNESPFYLPFGEEYSIIENILSEMGLSFFDIEEVKRGDDSAVDALIDAIEIDTGDNNNDDNLPDF